LNSALTVKDLKSKSFAKRIGAEKTVFKAGKKTPFRQFEMQIYPKRKYLSFGRSPNKSPRTIYLQGQYVENDDFRGFKNPVGYIRLSFDMFNRKSIPIYDTVSYKMVSEPQLEPIIELFYDILSDVLARTNAVFGILNNTSLDLENRDYNKWRSVNYIGGLSRPKYQEILLKELNNQWAKVDRGGE